MDSLCLDPASKIFPRSDGSIGVIGLGSCASPPPYVTSVTYFSFLRPTRVVVTRVEETTLTAIDGRDGLSASAGHAEVSCAVSCSIS